MLKNINFSEARAQLSPIFDQVLNDQQPIIVKRKRDEAFIIKCELQKQILSNYNLNVEEMPEDDGSMTLAIHQLAIVVNQKTLPEAIEDLISELKIYAEEYMNRLQLFLNAPNRKGHLPYTLRILMCESDKEIAEMLVFENATKI
ncbi:MAG: hypothetical protein H6Q69_223 [Firmicutes bacterium]|nr:hypothetical protein [Bacillota bacterium]